MCSSILTITQDSTQPRWLLFAFAGNAATANGAVALLDNMPSMDSTEVAQAKAQGAIILARGNMAEWAFSNAISIGSGLDTMLYDPCLLARRLLPLCSPCDAPDHPCILSVITSHAAQKSHFWKCRL